MNVPPSRSKWFLILCGIVLLVLNLQHIISWLEQLELRSLHARQLTIQENRFKSNISLVELDDTVTGKEPYSLFGRYPFRLEAYGYLNRFLARGKAKSVLYDRSFTSAPDTCNPQSDRFFVDSITTRPRFLSVLDGYDKEDTDKQIHSDSEKAAFLKTLAPEFLQKPVSSFYKSYGFSDIRPPLAQLSDSAMAFYPAASVNYDALGKAQRSILFSSYWKKLFLPNLSPAALMRNPQDFELGGDGKIRFGPYWIDTHGESMPIIRWYGNVAQSELNKRLAGNSNAPAIQEEVYPRYSFWPIVKSQLWWECQQNAKPEFCNQINFKGFQPINPSVFKDQWVLIGITSRFYDADTHGAIYEQQDNKYPGVYIQANILDNLMHNDFVKRPGWRFTLPGAPQTFSLITLLTALLIMAVTGYSCLRWRSVTLSVLFTLSLGIVYSLCCLWAYQSLNLWLNWIYPTLALLATFTVAYVTRYLTTERQKNQLRYAFQKYVSPAVMGLIEKNPSQVKLGGHRREMTILFCDIRGFTTYSESHSPEAVQELLTRYFTVMNDIILNQYGGSINKLIGDAIMAYWGFPLDSEDHAFRAVSAALKMREALEKWQKETPENTGLQIGIGISTGDTLVGNVGSQDFMDFTVIGDVVNTASRLEGVNKTMGTTILISGATYEKIKDRILCSPLGTVPLKGKDKEVEIFEPIQLIQSSTATQEAFSNE